MTDATLYTVDMQKVGEVQVPVPLPSVVSHEEQLYVLLGHGYDASDILDHEHAANGIYLETDVYAV